MNASEESDRTLGLTSRHVTSRGEVKVNGKVTAQALLGSCDLGGGGIKTAVC